MAEYLDICSADGFATGKIKERSSVHKDADWHRTVHVWIINSSQELLLQRRLKTKYSHPDKWDISSAGHMEAVADSLSTAIKETGEELGLTIFACDLEWLFSVKSSDKLGNGYIDNEFQDVYLVQKDVDLHVLDYQKEEVSGVKNIHYQELERLIKSGHPDYVPHPEEYVLLFPELHKRFPGG